VATAAFAPSGAWIDRGAGFTARERMIMNRSIDSRDLGALALRVALGVVFLAHAYAKIAIFTLAGSVQFFEAHGLPGWTVYPVVAIEMVGGLALVAGVRTRIASLALVPVMLGALKVHAPNGWVFNAPGGGWEFVAFLAVALVAQALVGAGAFALDDLVMARVRYAARHATP
jgi:putative oxidoreductase